MAEEKARILKVLEALSQCTDPARPGDIGAIIGETPFFVGHDLFDLTSKGLAQKPDKKKNLYLITDEGRQTLENPPDNWLYKPPGKAPSHEPPPGSPPLETTVPSQSDLFRDIGERLHIGIGRGGKLEGTPLDAIIYYIERTADLDNLNSVWNALAEMGVASDVRKRWIKLYAQNLPGKEIPEELKEKLEGGLEADKVKVETGEVPPKPKRFSVVNNEIIGDPEGDLSFKEALQYVAQQKGASPAEAESLAVALSKQPLDTISALMPLISKEPPPQDNAMVLALQQRIEQLADDKHQAEMDAMRTEMRSGQRSPEAEQQVQALGQQITDLRESLHDQQLARIQEQNQTLLAGLTGEINKLKEQIAAGVQGKQAESKVGLLSKTLDVIAEEAKGARQDLKSMAPTFLNRDSPLKTKTTSEKAGFSGGLDKGIEKARAASALEDELFFGPGK